MSYTNKDIYHERAWLHSRVDQVMVKCVVETTGIAHKEKLLNFLEGKGYPISLDADMKLAESML